ncbi:AN1-type zinc finger protein 5/6 [Pancytospora philotis]|nr:AN1-type zinc finger protein 5/6 [Pancytospora philotis]
MPTSKETINSDQPGDAPVDMCQAKMMKIVAKRKLISEPVQPVKQSKIVKGHQPNPEKCSFCDKKLKFTSAFMCRCENFYCNRHRFFDQHNCTFDYKTEARNKLKQDNPKVVARKLGE